MLNSKLQHVTLVWASQA